MASWRRGVVGARLALTTLTVAPLRTGVVDRSTAGVAMSIAPAVGAVLGAIAAAVGLGLHALGASPLLAGILTVASAAGLSRGLHLDGLADTVDALGSYQDRQGALAIMRRPDIGPFGVTAVVLVLLAQVAAAASILTRPWWAALAGIVAATMAGRLAITIACRRGVPPARSEGLGWLVAGTVRPVAIVLGTLATVAVAIVAVPDRPGQGVLAVVLALAAVVVLVRHAIRRFGGITGDILGAACELSVTVSYVIMSI